jgi:hypothetical protein
MNVTSEEISPAMEIMVQRAAREHDVQQNSFANQNFVHDQNSVPDSP